MAANHAQSVDQYSDKQVRVSQGFAVLSVDNPALHESHECLHSVRGAQHRMTMPMHELEVLNGVFDVDDSTWTQLGVHRAALDELFELLPAQVEGGCHIPGRGAIDITVPMGFDLFSEGGIAGDMAEFDHGLPFERRGESVLAVIRGDFVQRIGEKAFASVGTQADVEMKDAFLLGLDPLQQLLRKPFEVFAVLDAGLAVGTAGAAVDEQDLDIRCIA